MGNCCAKQSDADETSSKVTQSSQPNPIFELQPNNVVETNKYRYENQSSQLRTVLQPGSSDMVKMDFQLNYVHGEQVPDLALVQQQRHLEQFFLPTPDSEPPMSRTDSEIDGYMTDSETYGSITDSEPSLYSQEDQSFESTPETYHQPSYVTQPYQPSFAEPYSMPSPFIQPCFSPEVQSAETYGTVFTKHELRKLANLAKNFIGREPSYAICKIFYRNQRVGYFDEIEEIHGNIMTPLLKDNNGDPASPINRRLKGLFFATKVDWHTGGPMPFSYFGPKRYCVPAELMLSETQNIYFTDFFCMRKRHYVTLVLTKDGSFADDFCKTYLIKINLLANPFLIRNYGIFYVTNTLDVELFYTEDIDLDYWNKRMGCYFSIVPSRGTAKHTGIHKRKGCGVCNLITH